MLFVGKSFERIGATPPGAGQNGSGGATCVS
jgi:hypothetical protein